MNIFSQNHLKAGGVVGFNCLGDPKAIWEAKTSLETAFHSCHTAPGVSGKTYEFLLVSAPGTDRQSFLFVYDAVQHSPVRVDKMRTLLCHLPPLVADEEDWLNGVQLLGSEQCKSKN